MSKPNTLNSKQLLTFIERLEALDAEKKATSDDRTAVMAEAKAAGFKPKYLNHVVKARSLTPHALQEHESLRDVYMHSAGMAQEPPVFRTLSTLLRDATSRNAIIEAWKALVPENGEIIVKTPEGTPVRLWREKGGAVQVEDYRPSESGPGAPRRSSVPSSAPREIPSVDEKAAEELGRQAYRDNVKIIDNPFPFDHPNRPHWDRGWRAESGSDGMGGK